MKTPKRHYHVPPERQALDIEPDAFDEDYYLQEARWHRKNRIRQLKHTIARQAEEIEHYKNLLALAVIGEQYKLSQHCFDWAAKHIRVGMHPSSFDLDKTTQQITVTIPAPDVFIDGLKYPTSQFIKTYTKP